MKKLSAVVPKSEADSLIASLQRLSCIEIIKSEETENKGIKNVDVSEDTEVVNTALSETSKAIEFLTEYDTNKYGLFDAPAEASVESFDSGLDAIVYGTVRKANKLSQTINQLTSTISELNAKIEALKPWSDIKVSLPEDKTAHTVQIAGTFPQSVRMETVEEKLADYAVCLEKTGESGGLIFCLVSAHTDDAEAVRRVLSSSGFSKTSVTASKKEGYANGKLKELEESKTSCEKSLKEAKDAAVKTAKNIKDVKAFYDILQIRAERIDAIGSSGETKNTVLVSGWVPKKAVPHVEKKLVSHSAAYMFEDPAEGEEPPVHLDNNAFAKNYEPVVSMYALPAYGTFDPTMIMSVFYTVIFGLMFADFGYGLIIVLGCLLGLKLLHPKEGLARMLKMFLFCGVACMIAGVLFGSYFGDLIIALRENFGGEKDLPSMALAFDMIENPMAFLVVSLVLGAVHLLAGMAVKFYILCKDGHVFDAIFDVGSWFVLFAGIGVFFVNSLAGAIVAGIGALMLICTQGRREKNILMKIGKGVLSLYDIVSYASDLLSYSRVLALGLASAVIASVVNLLATMGGPTVAGIILFVFIFLIGHIINMAVNLLGTYVHTSRLQYIEFFGKFYETGGREFKPLSYKTKYVNLK